MEDKLAKEILKIYFEPCGMDCMTERQDLQLAITLNPSLDRIIEAMQAYHEAKAEQESKHVCPECGSETVSSEWYCGNCEIYGTY